MNFTSNELHDLVEQALDEVQRRLATGELDHSGRFYTDAELADHAAIRGDVPARHSATNENGSAMPASKPASR
jgi:hypothetical protein